MQTWQTFACTQKLRVDWMLHLGSNSKGEIIKKEFPLGLQRAEEAFAFGDFRVWMHLTVLLGGRRLSVAVALALPSCTRSPTSLLLHFPSVPVLAPRPEPMGRLTCHTTRGHSTGRGTTPDERGLNRPPRTTNP